MGSLIRLCFTFIFRIQYDVVILLGDRYETLSIAIAAGNTRAPIFHPCGGDTTEGAIDECVIGNSSSGIAEAPALHIPTANIGDRQIANLIRCISVHQTQTVRRLLKNSMLREKWWIWRDLNLLA